MNRKRQATFYLRAAMIVVALLLPALSLVVLGSLWLWQSGYLIHWVAGAFLFTAAIFLLQLWIIRRKPMPSAPETAALSPGQPDQGFTPRESEAWAAVEKLAAETDPSVLTSRDAIVDLGLRTVDTVARRIHPDDANPLWNFTVPEALALVERVSRDLRPFIADNIPLGDQLTVAQVMKIYRWHSVIDVAEKAYDLWRIIRILNPVAAVTNEAREQLTKKLYASVRDELARRLTRGYVCEVGRAAIDLYGGRLRVTEEALAGHVTEATLRDRADREIAEPLRILVIGQISAGKSSLINALLKDVRAAVDVLPATDGFTAYELKQEGLPQALLIDSPGLVPGAGANDALISQAGTSDLLIWVVAAHRADRALDHAAIDDIRKFFSRNPSRRQPALIGVVSHVDRLRPFKEWAPPYDLADPATEKARSIRAAVNQISEEFLMPASDLVPVSLDPSRIYNIEAVWAKVVESLPEAKRAQLIRRLRNAAGSWKWRRVWSQTKNAGKSLSRILTRAPSSKA